MEFNLWCCRIAWQYWNIDVMYWWQVNRSCAGRRQWGRSLSPTLVRGRLPEFQKRIWNIQRIIKILPFIVSYTHSKHCLPLIDVFSVPLLFSFRFPIHLPHSCYISFTFSIASNPVFLASAASETCAIMHWTKKERNWTKINSNLIP